MPSDSSVPSEPSLPDPIGSAPVLTPRAATASVPAWFWHGFAIALLTFGVVGFAGSLIKIVPNYLVAREKAHAHPGHKHTATTDDEGKETPKVPAAEGKETPNQSTAKKKEEWFPWLGSWQPWILLISALFMGMGLLWWLTLLIRDEYLDKHSILAHGLHEGGMALIVSCLIGGSIEMTIHVYHHIELAQQVRIRELVRDLLVQLGKDKGKREKPDYDKLIDTIRELRKNLQDKSPGDIPRLDELECTYLNECGDYFIHLNKLNEALGMFEEAKKRDAKNQKTLYNIALVNHQRWSKGAEGLEAPGKPPEEAIAAMNELIKVSDGFWQSYYQNITKGFTNPRLQFKDGVIRRDIDLGKQTQDEDLTDLIWSDKKVQRKAGHFVVPLEKGKSYIFRLERMDRDKGDPFLILYRDRLMESHDDEHFGTENLDSRIHLNCDFDGEWLVCATTALIGLRKEEQNPKLRLIVFENHLIAANEFTLQKVEDYFTQIVKLPKANKGKRGEIELGPNERAVFNDKEKRLVLKFSWDRENDERTGDLLNTWNENGGLSNAVQTKKGVTLSGQISFEEGKTLAQLDLFYRTLRINRDQFAKYLKLEKK